jgi:DNA-binding beta-propeller fold protein YncE
MRAKPARVGPAAILFLCAGAAQGQGGFANFELAPIHGAEVTPDGSRLLVTNTADDRLEVFTLGAGLPVWAGSIPVGLGPVAVRARTANEAWVVNQVSDTVSIVDLGAGNVVYTLKPGNEPCDCVFVGSGASQRAYVSVSRENRLAVFDPGSRGGAPASVALAGTCPRSLATDGTKVFAAFFEAGNRSSIAPRAIVDDPGGPWAGQNPPPNVSNGTFSPAFAPGLPPAPASSIVINREGNPGNWKDAANVVWDSRIPWALHEHGVAIYTPSTQALVYANNIANINMALAVQPSSPAKVTVVGHHLTNYVRFEPNHRSVFVRPYFSTFDPASPPGPTGGAGAVTKDMNSHLFANGVSLPYVTSPTPAQVAASVSDPRAVVWKDSATAYVACMGTANVLKVNGGDSRVLTINVGNGPCGIAYDAARARVYVLNRFDGTVSSISTANDTELGRVSFFDPTPAAVKAGRPVFYDAHATSKLGNASCNSCHVDTRSDVQSWDAGDPSGAMKAFNQTCDQGIPFSGVCADWHPVKGPLMTQNLADTVGFGPLHWRGDREDILAFGGGFTGFLGLASPPPQSQLAAMQAFFATLRREPNPYRTITDGNPGPGGVPGSGGDAVHGQALFYGPALGGAARCVDCHSQVTGGGLTIVSPNVLGQSQGLKTPPLRDLYLKTGFDQASTGSRRGFGFGHDGAVASIPALLAGHFAPAASAQDRADLEAFLLAFPSGTHPAVGVQVTFDAVSKNDPAAINLFKTLQALADSGQIGLIARGIAGGAPRGYAYVAGSGYFQSDRLIETVSVGGLRGAAGAGAEMTETAVAPGTERRIGIDRDGDGALDRDEIDGGSNPADAASLPAHGACWANCDGSTAAPALNVADFSCFLGRYASGDPYANCDGSTAAPVLNVSDFTCFLVKYAAGCP